MFGADDLEYICPKRWESRFGERAMHSSTVRSKRNSPTTGKGSSGSTPDPDTVAFVAKHAQGGLVDPIAGTGYWAYLLAQLGVDVVCYDLNPGAELVTNGWHAEDLYARVGPKDCVEAVALHPDRTLFLSWPPYAQGVGARIVAAYQGNRIIYIDEDEVHAGDDEINLILEKGWTKIDSRQPVQFWGIHDRLIVYERRS